MFGIVAYAHAEGVEQPVGVLTQYAATIGSSGTWGYLTPHANYQGVWSYGTYDSGAPCTTVGQTCPAWPGYAVTVDGRAQGAETPTYVAWWGDVLRGATTTGGPQYLRSRYYDANTGRFTRLDPVGLGVGMNLYGFAARDPSLGVSLPGARASRVDALRPEGFGNQRLIQRRVGGVRPELHVGCPGQDAGVAIILDGASQASRHPPEGQLPRQQHDEHHGRQQQQRVVRQQMFTLVLQHQPATCRLQVEYPLWHQNALSQRAYCSRTHVGRDNHAVSALFRLANPRSIECPSRSERDGNQPQAQHDGADDPQEEQWPINRGRVGAETRDTRVRPHHAWLKNGW